MTTAPPVGPAADSAMPVDAAAVHIDRASGEPVHCDRSGGAATPRPAAGSEPVHRGGDSDGDGDGDSDSDSDGDSGSGSGSGSDSDSDSDSDSGSDSGKPASVGTAGVDGPSHRPAHFPRASGILLHPTSLPGPHGCGDVGADARRFVDWLAAAGQQLWQVLPLGMIGAGNSPYASCSAFAGNVLLVDLAALQQQGWLDIDDLRPAAGFADGSVRYADVVPYRMQRLAKAADRFAASGTAALRTEHAAFCAAHASWLPDFALFMALTQANPGRDWCDWPADLAARAPAALAAARQTHAARIAFWQFAQWCFFGQWQALRSFAHSRGVRIVGDVPIFVAHHSADVWANQALFELGDDGRPTVVAGVPPDFFAATGQRWGNPLYRWSAHAADGHAWWVERMRRVFELVDIVRIDHFRGFAGYWEIPASEPTALNGRWLPGPGAALFDAIAAQLGALPVIAEDLGVITPDVVALRKALGFPGMRILQFAFDSDASNAFLPHNHAHDTVVYTGTHDNDTAAGWWASASEHERDFARRYFGNDGSEVPWTLIRAALASVADSAITPLQDVLCLNGEHRMNFPGQAEGWWQWRFEWQQLQPWHGERLAEMCRLYGRC